MILYTVISAWLCFYAGEPQFNYTISEHHRGPLLTVAAKEEQKMTEGCLLIDYVYLEEK